MNNSGTMELWRQTWRDGFVPLLTTENLEALRDALRDDDQRLTQGSTTTPPPLMCVMDWPVECGCALGFMGAMENGGFADEKPTGKCTNPNAATVGETAEWFGRKCFDAGTLLGETVACRHFLNFFDDTPRVEMRRELLAEVELALASRLVEANSQHLCTGGAA